MNFAGKGEEEDTMAERLTVTVFLGEVGVLDLRGETGLRIERGEGGGRIGWVMRGRTGVARVGLVLLSARNRLRLSLPWLVSALWRERRSGARLGLVSRVCLWV